MMLMARDHTCSKNCTIAAAPKHACLSCIARNAFVCGAAVLQHPGCNALRKLPALPDTLEQLDCQSCGEHQGNVSYHVCWSRRDHIYWLFSLLTIALAGAATCSCTFTCVLCLFADALIHPALGMLALHCRNAASAAAVAGQPSIAGVQ